MNLRTETGGNVKIIRSEMRTPDGTMLESHFVHDYVTHIDKNGHEYMLDGGLSYRRSSCWGDEEFLTVTTDDPHEVIREAVTWGTYGINGDQPLTHIKLMDMDTDHIQACIDTVHTMYPQFRDAMIAEIAYRLSDES